MGNVTVCSHKGHVTLGQEQQEACYSPTTALTQ
uniref:Uncharacterized protein n=1 Tax=Anguilla anguilla TaxID=7936 RepID=A0A0E9VKA6_ANGAN